MPIKLACFEVDNTILNFTLQSELQSRYRNIPPEDANASHLEERIRMNAPGIRHAESLKQTMHELLEKGIDIAIISYTPYQNLIPAVIDKIGLDIETKGTPQWNIIQLLGQQIQK
jgi:phosphoserine phosphatase